MDVFKSHPTEIFPFPVRGCSAFINEWSCTLLATPLANGTGEVKVRTSTNVTFTVTSEIYFDEPGSTIEFQTITGDGEIISLQQIAHGRTTDVSVLIGVEVLGISTIQWRAQAANLRAAMQKYGPGTLVY